MNFKNKLKTRLYTAITYISSGIIFVSLYGSKTTENQYLFSLGIALVIMGIARIIQYKRITKDEESIRRQKVAETDERNIAIINKSKSTAFGLYVFGVASIVIVLEILGITKYTNILALSVCSLALLYWICYWIYQKKS